MLRQGTGPFLAILIAVLLGFALPRVLPPLAIATRFVDDLLLARLAQPEPQNGSIVVIGLTESTLQSLPCRSPIDRVFLRGLVERLEVAGVRAIGIDVLFDAPTDPAADAALRATLRQASVPVVVITAHEATELGEAQRRHLDAFLEGIDHGYANLAKERLDGTVRWHEPRHETGGLSFSARIAGRLGMEVPEHPFEIAWHGRPDPATPPFPVYPAEAVPFLPPAWLEGKVALIGAVLDDGDRHRTPLSAVGKPTPGVEIQAHVVAQLLEGRTHPRLPLTGELLLVGTLALLGGLIGRSRLPFALVALLGAAGLLAYGALGVYAVARAGPLLPVVGGSLAWLGGLGGMTGMALWQERTERATLMRLFVRHVSAPVAEEIWRERDTFMAGGRPKAQELTATVLFSDIEDFTPVSERLGAVALMDWLEGYMERMVEIVAAERGLVLRFIGDAVLAVFGAPVARTSEAEIDADARGAVRSALAMARAIDTINAELAARGLPPIRVRIGIYTGSLVAGSLGGAEHVEYSLIGDSVNTAARLEAYAKVVRGPESGACTIVVGQPTVARLADAFELRPVGEVELKGKSRPVGVCELLGERATAARVPPSPDRPLGPRVRG